VGSWARSQRHHDARLALTDSDWPHSARLVQRCHLIDTVSMVPSARSSCAPTSNGTSALNRPSRGARPRPQTRQQLGNAITRNTRKRQEPTGATTPVDKREDARKPSNHGLPQYCLCCLHTARVTGSIPVAPTTQEAPFRLGLPALGGSTPMRSNGRRWGARDGKGMSTTFSPSARSSRPRWPYTRERTAMDRWS